MKKEGESAEPYKLAHIRMMNVSYLEHEALEEANTCVFKGSFYDEERKNVEVVIPPTSFFKLHKQKDCQQVFEKVGQDTYF